MNLILIFTWVSCIERHFIRFQSISFESITMKIINFWKSAKHANMEFRFSAIDFHAVHHVFDALGPASRAAVEVHFWKLWPFLPNAGNTILEIMMSSSLVENNWGNHDVFQIRIRILIFEKT